jgi:cytochrome c-L
MRPNALIVLCLLAAGPAAAQQAAQQTAVEGGQPAGAAAPAESADVTAAKEGGVEFRTVIGGKPLKLDLRPEQKITPAVEEFHRTGVNPYGGDEAAIAEGKQVYAKLCQSCHLPTGEGRIGPSLTDEVWNHPRLETEVGRFEIIYGGGAGAMQAFGRRIDQDEILKVMAYIDSFRG